MRVDKVFKNCEQIEKLDDLREKISKFRNGCCLKLSFKTCDTDFFRETLDVSRDDIRVLEDILLKHVREERDKLPDIPVKEDE